MKQEIKILDLVQDVKNLFKEDIPKTFYWDYIDQFKEHLKAIRSSCNHERSERIFNDYKRQIDSYLSNKWNEKLIDRFWETEMIATTLQQYHLRNTDELLTYFYDSLRSELNKIPCDSDTLLRLEEYFVELYVKNTLDEQYGLIDEFQRIPEVETSDSGITSSTPQIPKHDDIFANNGYVLWEHLFENNIKYYLEKPNQRGFQTVVSYYYQRLCFSDPKYIISTQPEFINFLIRKYGVEVSQIKSLDKSDSIERENNLSKALEWFHKKHKA
ncbi:hypothetical protein [Formosa haliotis]|uniref:hypothetical protein n=1 Tax=Formosa haliotis TaxID=1555194 RepID=UPI0008250BED|nr:hypothetical protein [Formosa haliotis]